MRMPQGPDFDSGHYPAASGIHSRIAWRFFRHAFGPVIECNSLAVGRVDLGEALIGLHALLVPIGTLAAGYYAIRSCTTRPWTSVSEMSRPPNR